MSKLIFSERAWEEYLYWQTQDRKTLKRINLLLKDIERNGNNGIGKAEALKFRDGWSKRIDDCNRLVYEIKKIQLKLSNARDIMMIDNLGSV